MQYYVGLSIRLLSPNTELKKMCVLGVGWSGGLLLRTSAVRVVTTATYPKRQSETSNENETEQENQLLTD